MLFDSTSIGFQHGHRIGIVLVFLMVVVVCFGVPSHAALTSGEVQALEALQDAFPALTDVALSFRQPTSAGRISQNWAGDFSNVCSSGDGYELFGVRCAGGHIDQIRWYALLLTFETRLSHSQSPSSNQSEGHPFHSTSLQHNWMDQRDDDRSRPPCPLRFGIPHRFVRGHSTRYSH